MTANIQMFQVHSEMPDQALKDWSENRVWMQTPDNKVLREK